MATLNRAAPTIVFEPAGHVYTVDGVLTPSVTQIIRPITGFIPRALKDAGAERGNLVHQACEFIDAGFEADVDPSVANYGKAYKSFLSDSGFVVLKSEYRVANPPARYAGTIDRVGRFRDEPDTYILDIKSGEMAFWMPLQLAAYAYGYWLMESGDAKVRLPKCMVLQLSEDGTYKVHEISDIEAAFDAFMALVRYHRWHQGVTGR